MSDFSFTAIWDFIYNGGEGIPYKIFMTIIILIAMSIIRRVLVKVIKIVVVEKHFSKITDDAKRVHTVRSILTSISKYMVYFIGGVTILSFYMDVTSILTIAGVGGIAIGFGAKGLIEDVVSGFFILLENQYSVDDYVTLGGFSGIVEGIGLRTTRLRDFSGDLHIIHNGKVDSVTNHSRGDSRVMFDIPVSYEEDMQKVMDVLDRIIQKAKSDIENITIGPNILGVSELDASSVNITILARTKPLKHWEVERKIKKLILEEFKTNNIEIPYNQLVIHKKQD